MSDSETVRLNINVECECPGGACEHMIVEVQKAVQAAYNHGVRDGATQAMENVTEFLQKHYPREFKEAEKAIMKERAMEKIN